MMLARIPMIAVLSILGIAVTGLGIGLVAAAKAPLGYQDDTGFHFGQQTSRQPEPDLSYSMPEPRPA
jgi:hypothetical protein